MIVGPFFVVFHFCFDLPQVSNCEESVSFIFIFCLFFKVLFFLFHFCFDLPQVSNCKESISFHFDFFGFFFKWGLFFGEGFGFGLFAVF